MLIFNVIMQCLKRNLCYIVVLSTCIFYTQISFAELAVNLTSGVTPISHSIYQLHMTILWICVAIGVGVFSVFFYSLIRYRRSTGHKAVLFHSHLYIEIIWAIIPLLILIAMAIPATHVLFAINDDTSSEMTIKITGHQWQWEYAYLDEGIQFNSLLSTPPAQLFGTDAPGKYYLHEVNHHLVVPTHKKIRLLFTSGDVIHSWWVPELGVKRDAMPGIITEAWMMIEQPGIYRGMCAELCGINHAFMPIVVEAKNVNAYDDWIQEQREYNISGAEVSTNKTMNELMAHGEDLYNGLCSGCHRVDGTGRLPTIPALRGNSVATGEPISQHIDIVLHGIAGTSMQAFADQLNNYDMASIITYERNAWNNSTGDIVQPSDIEQRR